jgi:ADP-heptose:LPS heptosyltransferase
VKRILVIRIDFLGDLVCTTPLMHAIKRRWPDAEIHALVNRYNAAVLERNPDVNQVHTYVYSKQLDRNPRPGRVNAVLDRLRLIWRLRKLRFDMIVVPNGGVNKNSIQFARQLGVADVRRHTAATEFDDRVAEHRKRRPMRHEALSGFHLLPEIGAVDAAQLKLSVYPDPPLKARWDAALGVKQRLRIGLFTSNGSAARRWPLAHWIALSEWLDGQAETVMFCSPAEFEERRRTSTSRWVSTPTTSDLIAAMSSLDLVVSADSAPVHLGAALGIPVVALFEARPEKFLRWYPLGVAHRVVHVGEHVETIPVAMVRQAVTELLTAVPV